MELNQLGSGYRANNEIKMKRLKVVATELNSDSLLIIKLPNSLALQVMSKSLFLALLVLALPSIVSILRGPPSFLDEIRATGSHSMVFRDLADEGLLKKGDKALIVSSDFENFMDYSEFLNENDIDLAIESDLDSERSIPDETFDLVFALNSNAAKFVDRVLKIGGLLVMQLGNDPSNAFQQHTNYKIVYLRRFDATVVAMRKLDLMEDQSMNNSPRKLQQCGGKVKEAKKAALKGLEDALLEPPQRRALTKWSDKLKEPKFLPDLLGDSLESYRQRIFITDHNGGGVVEWFYQNYPTRDQYFEAYNLGIGATTGVASDWLMKNVREEDFVVMKAEAQVVEEMVREKSICLVDELFLECKNQWEENEGKRAYWECLALYGRLRDEGVAVHQWWGD